MNKADVDMLHTDIIGKRIKVKDSKNISLVHLEGKVIDETKNTIVVLTEKGKRRLIKDQSTFIINEKTIPGKILCGRPEERLKKWFKKKRKLGSK